MPSSPATEDKNYFEDVETSSNNSSTTRPYGHASSKSMSASPSTYSLRNSQEMSNTSNGFSNSTPQQTLASDSQAAGKKKNMVSSLALGSLSISGNNGATVPRTPESNSLVFVCHQPTGVIGTSLVPPTAIGSNPALSNLHVFIPIEPPALGKKKKSKHSNLVKNSSSFLSKTIVHDSLSRRLGDRSLDSEYVLWVNMGRSLHWLDYSTRTPSSTAANISRENSLSKIFFFRSHPLCHDVNLFTRSANCLDVVVGMSTGDILWLDSANNKYARLNKNGDVTKSPVTAIKWVPGSENLFITLHANGALILFDKDREDGAFVKSGGLSHSDPRSTPVFRIVKSLYDDTENSTGGNSYGANGANGNGNTDNQSNGSKQNPLAVYKLSHKPLTSIEFSMDRQTVIVTSTDGYLRALNLATEVMTDVFPSYFGGILCCAFSPDGKYLATGGEDDIVSIWSVKRRSLIARGHGHRSWVRRVAFDPWNCDTEFNSYRLGSVGDEGDLLLWDFSSKTLSRPKVQQQAKKNVKKTNEKRHASMNSVQKPLLTSVANTSGTAASIYSNRTSHNPGNSEDLNSLILKPVVSTGAYSVATNNTLGLGTSVGATIVYGGSTFSTVPESTVVHPFVPKYDVPQLNPIVTLNVKFDFTKYPNANDPESNSNNNANGSGFQGPNGAANYGPNGIYTDPTPQAEGLSDIVFLEKTIMVASKDGRIWTWNRPKPTANGYSTGKPLGREFDSGSTPSFSGFKF